MVICLGSSTKYFGIEEAKTNTVPFRSIDDAILVHNKIQSFLVSKNSEIRIKTKKNDDDVKTNRKSNGNNINIIIVGGGATGVSLGGAIADLIRDQAKLKGNNLMPFETNLNVTIVEALSNILTGWNSELVSKARLILESKGVRVLPNSKVFKIEHDNLFLNDGSKIDSSLIIWTAGVKGYEIKVGPPTDKTNNGRIIVNRFCQIDKYPNIFVIGDIAAVKDSQGKVFHQLLR